MVARDDHGTRTSFLACTNVIHFRETLSGISSLELFGKIVIADNTSVHD